MLADSEHFITAFTERLMSFALGRSIEHGDMPAVRAIVRGAHRDNYRFSSLLLGVIESPQFQQRNAVALQAAPLQAGL
jgi:hypothetical protein